MGTGRTKFVIRVIPLRETLPLKDYGLEKPVANAIKRKWHQINSVVYFVHVVSSVG